MEKPAALEELIQALRCLPGVGPKSAQRMAYHLLQRDPKGAERLASGLTEALACIRHCARCNTFTQAETCSLCASPRRDAALLCVVESPGDLLMMEQSQSYAGLYFVLMGRLSPLDGVVKEVILATNFTVEGEATAHYISEMLAGKGLAITRIARGLPVGGELEHVDSGTLAQAVLERRPA